MTSKIDRDIRQFDDEELRYIESALDFIIRINPQQLTIYWIENNIKLLKKITELKK